MKNFLLSLLLCGGAPWLAAADAGAEPQLAATESANAHDSAYLGLFLQPVPAIASAQLKMEEGSGLAVVQIDPNAPVSRSDLKVHDIILKIENQPLYSSSSIPRILKTHKPGEILKFSVLRGGEMKEIKIELGRRQVTPVPAALPAEMQKMMEAQVADPKLPPDVRKVLETQLAQARRFARDTQVTGICSRINSRDKDHFICVTMRPDGSREVRIEDGKGAVMLETPFKNTDELTTLSPDLRDKVKRLSEQIHVIELKIESETKP